MSIADKLTQIAENQRRVYDAGYEAGSNGIQDDLDLSYCDGLTYDSLIDIIGHLEDFRETTTFTVDVPTNAPTTITNGTLEEGKQYTWSYYDATYPGWVVDGVTSYPTSEEVQITSTAKKIIIGGKEYVGFKASYVDYVDTPHTEGGNTIYVYQDGDEIKTYPSKYGIIKLNISTAPTETHSMVLGTINSNTLTDSEKMMIVEKGWELK